jgi:hypothetical protein
LCCPTPGCDGIGFCFDIWPTDPEWRDEHGNRVCFFDDEEYDEDEDFPEDDAEFPHESDSDANGQNRPPPDKIDEEDIPF